MLIHGGRDQCSFRVGGDTSQPYEQYSGVVQTQTEYKVAEILVGGQKDSTNFIAAIQNCLIVNARLFLCDEQNSMSVCPESIHDLLLYVLIRDEIHAWTCSIG